MDFSGVSQNPSKDEFVVARNEPSPRFVSNGIHIKGDAQNLQGNDQNLQGNGYEKDPSSCKDQTQRGNKGEEI